ncbi:MAG: 30S ribosomal protein S6, partial [Desulfobacterales bacterium]|nr:30S ribosomal protein S6 [Desulfobacterales bacterium]
MRRYETVFVVNPELSEEQRQPLFDKLKGLLSEDQGMLVEFDEWGHKRLAYEIKKHTRGYYVLMDFCGDGVLVKEIERNMRLDDRVLKYMTVLKDKTVDVEAIKAEIEAAKEQESKPESTEQATGEVEDKGDSESTETEEAPVSESEVPEEAPVRETEVPEETPVSETEVPEETPETSE